MAGPGVVVVGFSGPDGAGKSSLRTAVAAAAVARGWSVRSTYLYGCVVCRNLRPPGRLLHCVASPGTVALERPDASCRAARLSSWRRFHATIDSVELALRLRLVRAQARRTARRSGRDALVLTDRTPLDALVKHDPPADAWFARRLLALGSRYTSIALLDAGSDVLSARDGEHQAPGLQRAREGYGRWSGQMAGVWTVCTQSRTPDELARAVLDHVLDGEAGSRAGHRAATDTSRYRRA